MSSGAQARLKVKVSKGCSDLEFRPVRARSSGFDVLVPIFQAAPEHELVLRVLLKRVDDADELGGHTTIPSQVRLAATIKATPFETYE